MGNLRIFIQKFLSWKMLGENKFCADQKFNKKVCLDTE